MLKFFNWFAQRLNFSRLIIITIILQILFLLQIGIIWRLSNQLQEKQAQQESQGQEQAETIVTPGMIRGLK